MEKPDYVVSDTHLGAVPRETEREFLRFLEHVGANAGQLVLAGDLFDFWFEWGTVIPGKQFRVLAALAALVDAGVPVSMVGGNHDAWGGRFLREHVGMTYTPGMLRMRLGGRSALVAHGDGVGVGDLRYRVLKAVFRSRAAIAGFRFLHPEVGVAIARRMSTTESKADEDARMKGRAEHIRAWARGVLAAEPELQLVVCGHAHAAVVEEVAPGRHYLNSGDWIRNRSYAVVAPGEAPVVREWR